MSQSLARVLTHLIFSTKNRVRVLPPRIRLELHPYLAVVLREHRCPALQVGGIEDHVHLLFGLSRVTSLAEVVETVKTSSSKWIKGKGPDFRGFYWQAGYGAFSVSQSEGDAVIDYIRCQEEHHKKCPFRRNIADFSNVIRFPTMNVTSGIERVAEIRAVAMLALQARTKSIARRTQAIGLG